MDKNVSFYVVDGNQISLNRVTSARFVAPQKSHHMAHVAARLGRSTRLALQTDIPREMLVVRGDVDKLEEVKGYEDVRCTRSVFADASGHEVILTDEVLVCFRQELSTNDREQLCRKLHCRPVDPSGDLWRLFVEDNDDDAPLAIANELSQASGVEYAEPRALQSARFFSKGGTYRDQGKDQPPSPPAGGFDPLFGNQWHLENTGQNGGTPEADVRARAAWEITEGSPNIRVCVHDSGVDILHPDLKANIDPGWDFDNNDIDATNDNGPHGTACAGVIAAPRNNEGVMGIAPKCRIVPLRAAGALPWDTWAKTFAWAAQRSDIISCSWSISPNNTLSAAIRKVVNEGRNGKGIPVFCATGNGFTGTISYPASMPETIAVGASTNQDIRSAYSQYGRGIDFVAPSSGGTLGIETTDVRGPKGYNKKAGGDYCKADDESGFGGTSSATPLAAGVAALVLSINSGLTAQEVRETLRDTSDKIDAANARYDGSGWSPEYGHGRVNAAEAVQKAQPYVA